MSDVMTGSRRSFLMNEGQSLLIAHDPFQLATNFVKAVRTLGIEQEQLVSSRLSPFPFPLNSGRTDDDCCPRHPGIAASMLWLPVFWLPGRLDQRYDFQIIDGEVQVVRDISDVRIDEPLLTETDDLWVTRVALELTASGLYDDETGTWLDALSLVDIDIDSDDGLARVEHWLAGGRDTSLDLLDTGFEMNEIITDQSDPTWALTAALLANPLLVRCAWALGSDRLGEAVEDLLLSLAVGDADDAEAEYFTKMVCGLGGLWMQGYGGDAAVEDALWDGLLGRIAAVDDHPSPVDNALLSDIIGHLAEVKDSCWPVLDELAATDGASD